VLPLIMGTFLGMVFGASSLYLVLKVGLTGQCFDSRRGDFDHAVSRYFSKLGLKTRRILENNIVQTAGSAGESIAFGVGVTMPAIMILVWIWKLRAACWLRCWRLARHPDDDSAAARADCGSTWLSEIPEGLLALKF